MIQLHKPGTTSRVVGRQVPGDRAPVAVNLPSSGC